jgi:hypothetical protein
MAFKNTFSEDNTQQNYFFTLLIEYITETGQSEPAFFWNR